MELTAAEARNNLYTLLKKYADFGAMDSEPMYMAELIEEWGKNGQPLPKSFDTPILPNFPLNPFELYESREGWEQASNELREAGRTYWKALIQERLGVGIE